MIDKETSQVVYCSQCGSYNGAKALNCTNCGASLMVTERETTVKPEYYSSRGDVKSQRQSGGSIGLLIGGLILVMIGVAAITGFTMFWSYFWPIMIILLGLWLLLLWYRRNNKTRHF